MTARRNRAIAFLEQAADFYQAASSPRIGSKPLLYYYSFMNLAKAFLTVHTQLDLVRCTHGLREPADNVKRRLTIASQTVIAEDASRTRVQVYREFVRACGFALPQNPQPVKVVDLLEQIVGIHRITSHTLKRDTQYFPIRSASFEHDPRAREAWISIYVARGDVARAASALQRNTLAFSEVESPNRDYRRYESLPMAYTRSPIDVLRELVRSSWQDLWSELRPGGYRFWLSSVRRSQRRAQLASGYKAMFYFGSVSRYRPDDYQKLVEGKHGWMVQEFMNTQPIQFVYFLGSGLVDAEMVVPELA